MESSIFFFRQHREGQEQHPDPDLPSPSRQGTSAIMTSMLLSLYMLLLAIFILLNSITTYEESRVRQALGSVADKFRTNTQLSDDTAPAEERSGDSVLRTTFFSGLEQMFAERLPIAAMSRVQDGNVMQVTLPTERIFREGSMEVLPDSESFLNALADSLVITRPELRYEIELLISSGAGLPSGAKLGEVLEIRRAGNFARQLRLLGVGSEAISIGLKRGDPETIQFSFFARRINEASITFEGVGER
jgi:hypothetical protein